jgi:hypothetical protein
MAGAAVAVAAGVGVEEVVASRVPMVTAGGKFLFVNALFGVNALFWCFWTTV